MSVHHVTIDEAKKRFTELFDLAVNGEEIVIDNGHGKTVKIIVQEPVKKTRIAGLSQGKGRMSDDFDEYLGDDFWLGGKQ